MNKIKNIDINVDDLKNKLEIGEKAKEIAEDNKEIKSFYKELLIF